MESTHSNNSNLDIQSLEEGRFTTNNSSSHNDVVSGKSQRTVRSRKPRRRNTILSNHNRQRANSSFQYPSNMSVFSSGASIRSPSINNSNNNNSNSNNNNNNSTNNVTKSTTHEQPNMYQYEIVPTAFPHPDNDTSSDVTAHMASPSPAGNQDNSQNEDGNGDSDQPPKIINNGSKVIVRPKQIHQNPLTPTILPKGFTPINEWGRRKAKYHKEWLAEFLGTMVMTILGDGCSLQNILGMKAKEDKYLAFLSAYNNSDGDTADLLTGVTMITQGYSINVQLGWGGAVLCGYFAAGGSSLSGAHLNMCVTLSNFFFRGSPKWKLVLAYVFAQLLGAYVGGLLLFGYYRKVIETCYPDWKTNQDLFSAFVTVPVDYLSSGRQFISEAVASMFLIMGIFAMTDPYNNTSNELFPLYLFILIYTLMAAMSLQTEAAINFGRDFGPRLALLTVGADKDLLFDSNHHYFWVPIVGPVVGGLWGAFAYDLLIFRGHESWVNRPLYQNIDALERKWYKFKRVLNKRKRSKYSSNDDDDSDDEEEEDSEYENGNGSYVTDSDTEIGDGTNHNSGNTINFDSDKESEVISEDHGELSDSGGGNDGYDRMSLNGLDTFSLNDIPEEDMDDLELTHTNTNGNTKKNKQTRSILYDSEGSNYYNNKANSSTSGGNKKNRTTIGKRDIHFKSSGKNRRFVPTL